MTRFQNSRLAACKMRVLLATLFLFLIYILYGNYERAVPVEQVAATDRYYNVLAVKYLSLLEMALTGSLTDEAGRCNGGEGGCALTQLAPYDNELRRNGNDWPPFGHTMVGHLRLQNIQSLIKAVVSNNISGDYAELGVWRGGASIYAKAVLDVLQQHQRSVYVFDAFESLPGYGGHTVFLHTTEHAVRHNFAKYGVLDERVKIVKGLFKVSVPSFSRNNTNIKLAILRIDGNFYDSYQDALYHLYEHVPVGGYIIFDDIRSHPAVQQCWEDFTRDQGVVEDLIPIDVHSAYFMKTKIVKINFNYMKAPRDANKEPQ